MKEEIKDKWVEALRSGKYKQCKGRLQKKDGYCCLGVLCDISGIPFDVGYTLPDNIKNWSGMVTHDGTYRCKDLVYLKSLVILNDGRNENKNFNEIADVIEEVWEDL